MGNCVEFKKLCEKNFRPTKTLQTVSYAGARPPRHNLNQPHSTLETYTLTIEGEVEKPVKLNWNDFLKLPQTVSLVIFTVLRAGVFWIANGKAYA